MQVSNLFPSTYLKASDLQGRSIDVIINRFDVEVIGQDQRPVIYFEGKTKGLVLNKTNSGTISDSYGDETDDWIGQPITVYPSETDYQGKRVPCIRVRVPRPARAQYAAPVKPAPAAAPAPMPAATIPMDDEIPF